MTITEKNKDAFEEAYEKAAKDKKEYFIFENLRVFTNYAKYLIDYLNQ